MRFAAVGEQRMDRDDVLAGVAVTERAAAAGVVRGHAADGGARGGRDVDRKPQTMGFELAVEIVEHDAGLDADPAAGDVEIENFIEMPGAVDDDRMIHRLPGL